jgi:hypothetical protein
MTFINNKLNLAFNSNLTVNSIVIVIFLLLNPLYGLFITTLASLFTKRISYLLVGILFVLSFSLMFANQYFAHEASDLSAYLRMYHGLNSDEVTIISIFNEFTSHINHKEPLWRLYSMLVGGLTNYSNSVFVLTTYAIIFSLSAFAAHLISEKGRYNPILILFSTIFVELSLVISGYNQWRIIIATLVFLIGLVIYNPDKTKFISRAVIYSSVFIHIALIPYALAFEIYSFLVYRKISIPKDGHYYLRILLLTIIGIVIVYIFSPILIDMLKKITLTTPAYQTYLNPDTLLHDLNIERDFEIMHYFKLMFLLLMFYVFFNWKYLQSYEVFAIMAFIVIEVVQFNFNVIGILFTRAALIPHVLFLFISTKVLLRLRSIYIFYFVCLVFFIRIFKMQYHNLYYQLENIAKGDLINPNYGLITSIIYYEPIFIN